MKNKETTQENQTLNRKCEKVFRKHSNREHKHKSGKTTKQKITIFQKTQQNNKK